MPPVDYSRLTEAEARANLERYVAGLDGRVAWLQQQLGHPLGTDDDTLVEAWGWFLRWAPEHRDDDVDPPDWYARDDPPHPGGLTPAELHGVDAVAAQFARVLQRAAPQLRWDIGKERPRLRYVYQHAPVLKGYGCDVAPVFLVMVSALRALRRGNEEALENDEVLTVHRIWLDNLGVTPENVQLDPALEEELLFEVIETDPDDSDFQWEVHLHDVLAGMYDDGLDELTAQLRAVEGVEKAHHEDREVWLVRGSPRRHDLERVVQTWIDDRPDD